MCSIVMPADYEMLVSHSPPIFSHSPPSSHFLTRCDSYTRMTRLCKQQQFACAPPRNNNNNNTTNATATLYNQQQQFQGDDHPTRPILIVRADHDHDDRLKKRVVFADDRGMSLTHVRIMAEPSNVPPVWSVRFLQQVTHGMHANPVAAEQPWEVAFAQPASDYVAFRKRLDAAKVSLENVIVKEQEAAIVGTIKVCNLAFEKDVRVRWTRDAWRTHADVACAYMPCMASASAYALYDTFQFKLDLPPEGSSTRRIDFCVLYKCDGVEFWDNNQGANYTIEKRVGGMSGGGGGVGAGEAQPITATRKRDIFHTKMDSWSEFASWNHLDTTSPFW